MKNYILNLSDKLGKEFYDITQMDMELDMKQKAQEVYMNDASSKEDLAKYKEFLPKKPIKFFKGYEDVEKGFKIGMVVVNNGICYLIVK